MQNFGGQIRCIMGEVQVAYIGVVFFFICRDFISVNKMIDLLQVDLSYVLKIERSELQCMRSRSERTKKSRGITNQENIKEF